MPTAPSRSLRRTLGDLRHRWRSHRARQNLLQGATGRDLEPIPRAEWAESLRDPTAFYARCFRRFHRGLDPALRAHREYFTREGRGFGEDVFHVLWQTLYGEIRPANFLEIGVFRGQTLSLVALLARRAGARCEVFGISPFDGAGDSACDYPRDLDYQADIRASFARFELDPPHLERAYSTDPAARALVQSRAWDLVYIDGNHDDPVVRADWELCAANVRVGGLIVMDDAGACTGFRPPIFATGGFPDVSRFVGEIDAERFPLVLQVGHNLAFERRR